MANTKENLFGNVWIRGLLVLLAFILAINIPQVGSFLRTVFGKDVAGWTQNSKDQVRAHQALRERSISQSTACIKGFTKKDGTQFTSVEEFTKYMVEAELSDPKIDACLNQINKGPSSPRDDIPDIINGIKKAFSSEQKEVVLIDTIAYDPRREGPQWIERHYSAVITKTECAGGYTLNMQASGYPPFGQPIPCGGLGVSKTQQTPPAWRVAMPDPHGSYGAILTKIVDKSVKVTANIPHFQESFREVWEGATIQIKIFGYRPTDD